MTCYSNSTVRDEILTGMARAFFCTAYADHVEQIEEEGGDHDLPRPGPNWNWMDFLPDLPGNAWAMAGSLWSEIEILNKRPCGMFTILQEIEAQEVDPVWATFGHYLAMEAMGHGVSWSDDHAPHGLKLPHVECSRYTFDEAAYQPDEE